jgi:hypothetical protein
MSKNPKPLDLEDLKEFAPNKLTKVIMSKMIYGLYNEEKLVNTKEEAIELGQILINEIIKEIKQRVKQTVQGLLEEIEEMEKTLKGQKEELERCKQLIKK